MQADANYGLGAVPTEDGRDELRCGIPGLVSAPTSLPSLAKPNSWKFVPAKALASVTTMSAYQCQRENEISMQHSFYLCRDCSPAGRSLCQRVDNI